MATSRKQSAPGGSSPVRRVTLESFEGGAIARYQWKTYRFLLDDGSTLDVQAIQDDSDLRGAVLEHTKAERIAGVVTINHSDVNVSTPVTSDRSPTSKRTIKRRAT
jgi:hypothetical protein